MREYLINIRKEKGYTQAQIAKKAGIAASYYNAVEKDDRQHDMSLSMILKLSKALDIDTQLLFDAEAKYAQEREDHCNKKAPA
ncbi:MAG TPA: helix-turn-helix transcriptional regulator [Clostridiales bacterium]|nr:helix-turn-helix transcriptional regulator [Clostridiales bacterium]